MITTLPDRIFPWYLQQVHSGTGNVVIMTIMRCCHIHSNICSISSHYPVSDHHRRLKKLPNSPTPFRISHLPPCSYLRCLYNHCVYRHPVQRFVAHVISYCAVYKIQNKNTWSRSLSGDISSAYSHIKPSLCWTSLSSVRYNDNLSEPHQL